MLLLLKRSAIIHSTLRCYSTVPKKAAGKFTSNKLISQPNEGHLKDVQATLVYIGMVTNRSRSPQDQAMINLWYIYNLRPLC